MTRKIGIIGFGHMGRAIGERLKADYPIVVFDKDVNKISNLSQIKVAKDLADLLKATGTLILAVKPQDFDTLLKEIKDYAQARLIISIAAGITTSYIEKVLGNVRIIRVMPNIGAKIGQAQTSLCKGKYAKDEELGFAKELFDHVGKTWIMEEEMIDAATAISGSGPAYIYYDMEVKKIDASCVSDKIRQEYIDRLREAAIGVGLDPQIALELAGATTAASISVSVVTGIPPAELRKQVTSKGGTTEAAIKVLIEGGSWQEAALAAKRRAKELSKI